MSCHSSGCLGKHCPCNYVSWFPRIAFGLIFVGLGVNHYRNLGGDEGFIAASKAALAPVGDLATVAGYLAYIVPGLMIVGGALFAFKLFDCVAKTCLLVVLSGIIGWASLAILVGNAGTTGLMMPQILNASILVILYSVIRKMSCCGMCPTTPSMK